MLSRLHEMCEFLHLDGADYRELPSNGGVDDLVMLWKKRKLAPAPAAGRSRPARAQLRGTDAGSGKRELPWSGGKAGS